MKNITRVYIGTEGCRCGCRGNYAEKDESRFKGRVKRFLKMWENYSPTEDDIGPNYKNISYGNNRVITVYFD